MSGYGATASKHDHGRAQFGRLVRQRREQAGMSQQQLAEQSGMSVRAIGNIERGRTGRPRHSSLALLASSLGIRVQDLARAAWADSPAHDRARDPAPPSHTAHCPAHGAHSPGPQSPGAHSPGPRSPATPGPATLGGSSASAQLAARVITHAERELGPGGSWELLDTLTRTLAGDRTALGRFGLQPVTGVSRRSA